MYYLCNSGGWLWLCLLLWNYSSCHTTCVPGFSLHHCFGKPPKCLVEKAKAIAVTWVSLMSSFGTACPSYSFYYCDKQHDQRHLGEERVCLYTCLRLHFIAERSCKGNLEAELKQSREECCLLACSPLLAQADFLHHQDFLLTWHHPQWTTPPPISHQFRKMPCSLAHRQSDGGTFSIESPLQVDKSIRDTAFILHTS